MGQAEEPDRGALPVALARMHPACAPWFAAQDTGAVRPVAASPQALASLAITTNTSFVYQQVPSLPAGQAPVEVRLLVSVTNTGSRAISLLGIKVPLAFSPRVLVPTQPPRWAAAYPDQFFVDCWGGQVTTQSGQRPPNDGNACQYVSLVPSANGMDLTFAGGSLCPGCTLAGFGGPMFAVKQVNYSPLELGTRPPLQPTGPTSATIPPAPPVMCGLGGAISTLGTSSAAAPARRRGNCPSRSDLNGAHGNCIIAPVALPPDAPTPAPRSLAGRVGVPGISARLCCRAGHQQLVHVLDGASSPRRRPHERGRPVPGPARPPPRVPV